MLYTRHCLRRHRDSLAIKGIFTGLRPVVVGLIASAALLLMNDQNFGTVDSDVIKSICICAASFCLVFWAKLHPILVIVLAGIAGYIIF